MWGQRHTTLGATWLSDEGSSDAWVILRHSRTTDTSVHLLIPLDRTWPTVDGDAGMVVRSGAGA